MLNVSVYINITMKHLKNLKGVKAISKSEQKSIIGGYPGQPCNSNADCIKHNEGCYIIATPEIFAVCMPLWKL